MGAGYTGLWTAYYLKRADPALRVVVLEREFAGYGASGRNGGWVAGAVSGVHDDATVAAITATVDEVGRAAAAEGIECGFHKGGALAVATGPTQLERLRDHPLAHGEWLEPDALRERVRIQARSAPCSTRTWPACSRPRWCAASPTPSSGSACRSTRAPR